MKPRMVALQYGEYIVVDRGPSPGGPLSESEYIIQRDPTGKLRLLIEGRAELTIQLSKMDGDRPNINWPHYVREQVRSKIKHYDYAIKSLSEAIALCDAFNK